MIKKLENIFIFIMISLSLNADDINIIDYLQNKKNIIINNVDNFLTKEEKCNKVCQTKRKKNKIEIILFNNINLKTNKTKIGKIYINTTLKLPKTENKFNLEYYNKGSEEIIETTSEIRNTSHNIGLRIDATKNKNKIFYTKLGLRINKINSPYIRAGIKTNSKIKINNYIQYEPRENKNNQLFFVNYVIYNKKINRYNTFRISNKIITLNPININTNINITRKTTNKKRKYQFVINNFYLLKKNKLKSDELIYGLKYIYNTNKYFNINIFFFLEKKEEMSFQPNISIYFKCKM